MKISIVTTAYNVDKYIKQTIESVLAQTYKDIEMVVVLDKPTDKTEEIVDSFSKKIKIIKNEDNLGAGMSRRIGIEAATGDYVMLLDGDDWLDKGYIKQCVKYAEETDADIVNGGFTSHTEDGKYLEHGFSEKIIAEGYDKFTRHKAEDLMFMNNKIIRRSLLLKYPYCDRRYIEDTPTYFKVLWSANKVVYIPNECGYHYRVRQGSLGRSATDVKNLLYCSLCWFELYEFFLNNDPKVIKIAALDERITAMIKGFNSMNLTIDKLEQFKDDWLKYISFFNRIFVIEGVGIKQHKEEKK